MNYNLYYKRARAIYSNADIYLFDDSLSAVDGSVGKFLLNKYWITLINIYVIDFNIYATS